MTAKIMKRRGGGGGYYNADGVTLKVKILVEYLKIFSEEKKQIYQQHRSSVPLVSL